MATIQLNFTLRTSSNCKTVHLLGSWDNYAGQLPLSKDSRKSGGWLGCFKFGGAMLKQGQRYWYYYIIDGYHVSHDPAKDHTTEPTTGRKLNILDIPGRTKTSSSSAAPAASSHSSSRHSRRSSAASIPKGRPVSPSKIVSPTPVKPNQTRQIVNSQYDKAAMEALATKFSRQTISPASSASDDSYFDSESDDDSDVPSLTSRSTNSSSPSSVSSGSVSSCCTCERYGITRAGERVRLDCGGARCGYSDDSSECSSEDERVIDYEAKTTRRQGVVIRT